MNNLCLINLAGIPAAGKSTFCRQFCDYLNDCGGPFNALHIEFDEFVKIPTDGDQLEYFGSKTFKRDRFRLRWLIRALIDAIKTEGSMEQSLNLFRADYPDCTLRTVLSSSVDAYILLIDDNMYYKSMRKEIRSIAKESAIGYLILHLDTSIDPAMRRNRHRTEQTRLADDIISRMADKFESPQESDEAPIFHINVDECIAFPFEMIVNAIRQSMCAPLAPQPVTSRSVVEQSQLHRIDLMLRRKISQNMNNLPPNVDKKMLSAVYCQKRKLILNDLRCGLLELPNDFLELENMLFTHV